MPKHAFLVKHMYKACRLIRKFLSGSSNKGGQGKDPPPITDDTEEKDNGFPMPNDCLMIFEGLAAYGSKCRQKVTRREVYMAQPATHPFLRWSESTITFDRTDHPDTIPYPGGIRLSST